ncbi:MAG TPA: DUF4082 domain-containing protein [Candidatus Saccharimonadales bacterium]
MATQKPKTKKKSISKKPSPWKNFWSKKYVPQIVIFAAFALVGTFSIIWARAATTSYSILQGQIPKTIVTSDRSSIELGLKFRAKVAGQVTGVRFYKAAQNTGTHTGTLWDRNGNKLATVTFTDETSSGWQSATFAQPIDIAANTTYVVSYHAPNGRYSQDIGFFRNNRVINNNLVALQNGTDGPNGVFKYSSKNVFPTDSYRSSNYWVDVVFSEKLLNPTPAPAPPAQVYANQQNTTVAVSWQPSISANPIQSYNVIRNGATIGSSTTTTFTDSNVTVGQTYSYQIQAVDNTGAKSALSTAVSITIAGSTPTPTPPPPSGMRTLPDPLYGMTVDDVSNVSYIVAAAKASPRMPITRIVFDENTQPSDYTSAVNGLQPYSYIMGELLDSYYLPQYSVQQYHDRTAQFLSAFGNSVDLWEIGNEVNGNWTGNYNDVGAKITDAYNQVSAAGKRSALTLYYDIGCGNGPSELDPIAFSQQHVPASVRQGLNYIFLSYYEADCNNIRPSAETWTNYFNQLRQLYPNAKVGFGEVGLPNPATSTTLPKAQTMLNYYYGLKLGVPGYVGGYFWWYAYEDFLPVSANKPLWQSFTTAIQGY